eukprot:5295009-Amphidinium_carterae.1
MPPSWRTTGRNSGKPEPAGLDAELVQLRSSLMTRLNRIWLDAVDDTSPKEARSDTRCIEPGACSCTWSA